MHLLYGCCCSCIRILRVFHVLIEAANTPRRQQVEFLRFYKIRLFILFLGIVCVCMCMCTREPTYFVAMTFTKFDNSENDFSVRRQPFAATHPCQLIQLVPLFSPSFFFFCYSFWRRVTNSPTATIVHISINVLYIPCPHQHNWPVPIIGCR